MKVYYYSAIGQGFLINNGEENQFYAFHIYEWQNLQPNLSNFYCGNKGKVRLTRDDLQVYLADGSGNWNAWPCLNAETDCSAFNFELPEEMTYSNILIGPTNDNSAKLVDVTHFTKVCDVEGNGELTVPPPTGQGVS